MLRSPDRRCIRGRAARAAAGLEDTAELIEGDAFESLPAIDDVFDLVFIDAEKEDYERLFELARGKLEPGALVVNFMDDDPKFDQTLERLERAFGGAVVVMPALYDPNIVAFAFKGLAPAISWDVLKHRAEKLESKLGLPFTRYVSRLRAMNRWTAAELIIAP